MESESNKKTTDPKEAKDCNSFANAKQVKKERLLNGIRSDCDAGK